MRKSTSLLLFLLVFVSFPLVKAQSVLYYNFFNTLNEVNGAGPVLSVLGNAGVYVTDTLSEIQSTHKTVYRFEKNNGVQFNNTAAGNFLGGTYTIELYFKFDELTSWKRVVDWKNRKTDMGAYVYYGQLNFYDIITSNEAPVVAGEYTYYVITRDGASKKVLIYTDADVKVDFIDSNDDAVIDADGVLNFFYDDLSVPNEASSGAVALLKLYNYALDSSAIRTNWNTIGSNVFGVSDGLKSTSRLIIYPNPATTQVAVDLLFYKEGEKVKVTIMNSNGQQVYSTFTDASNSPFVVATNTLGKGLYFLRTEAGNRTASGKFLIR